MSPLGFATLGGLLIYLAAFALLSRLAARAAGQSVWRLGRAEGRDRWSAWGFRLVFALAVLGPLVQVAVPVLREGDPIWREARGAGQVLPACLLAVLGALLALAGQIAMGASWRVGVAAGAVGALVTAGPLEVSRNPVFMGQFLLLGGVALAVPSLPGLAAVLLFWLSARAQVQSEEHLPEARHGEAWRACAARVPRWPGLPRRSVA